MLFKIVAKDITIYRSTRTSNHNPHGPAVRYVDNEIAYYLKGKQQNIVGPTRIKTNSSNRYNKYYIKGILIGNSTNGLFIPPELINGILL